MLDITVKRINFALKLKRKTKDLFTASYWLFLP